MKTAAQQADAVFWKKVAAGEMHTMASVRKYAQRYYPGRWKQWCLQYNWSDASAHSAPSDQTTLELDRNTRGPQDEDGLPWE